jgi:hypothetical protein
VSNEYRIEFLTADEVQALDEDAVLEPADYWEGSQ